MFRSDKNTLKKFHCEMKIKTYGIKVAFRLPAKSVLSYNAIQIADPSSFCSRYKPGNCQTLMHQKAARKSHFDFCCQSTWGCELKLATTGARAEARLHSRSMSWANPRALLSLILMACVEDHDSTCNKKRPKWVQVQFHKFNGIFDLDRENP